MKMSRRFSLCCFLIVCMCFAIFSSTSCRKDPLKGRSNCLGVVLKENTSPLFAEIEQGIRKEAETRGVEVIILSPDGRDPEEQTPLLEKVIEMKVSAILFAPETDKSCIPVLIRAHSLAIPLILIDTDIDRKALGNEQCITCIVGCDNKMGGMLAGNFLGKRLKGQGTVAIIEGINDRSSEETRKEGFYESLRNYPGIKNVNAPQGGFQKVKAYRAFNELKKKNPDIKGIFATNDLMAIGVSDANKANNGEKLYIVGYNATKEGLEALKEGRIDATVNQFPLQIGKTAVDTALKALKKEKLPPSILFTPELITKEKLLMPFN